MCEDLQFSITRKNNIFLILGIRMTIDMNRPEGSRITDLKVRCSQDCQNSIDINNALYEEIIPNKNYPVVGTKFLLGGNDGYKALKESYRDKIEGKSKPYPLS